MRPWKKPKQQDEVKEEVIASINFELLEDGTINFTPIWNNENLEHAELAGILFQEVNEGYYQQDILDYLINICKEEPDKKESVKRLLEAWKTAIQESKKTTNYNNDNIAVVQPIKTFGASRFF